MGSSILYIPHGGGPMPLLGDPGHSEMVEFLQRITPELGRPEAVLVISAHWEEERTTVTSGAFPTLLYDYFGFPPESYEIKYPAPGNAGLAKQIQCMLAESEIEVRLDDQRGFDHGVFVPLKIMYPAADIPCVQLSLLRSLNAVSHLQIGKALAGLKRENLLILGSGFSFHNLRQFSFSGPTHRDPANDAFQEWLIGVCTDEQLTQAEREKRLAEWQRAPSARYCHPREEHLLPLHVCAGIAGSAGTLVFDGNVVGKRSAAFLWK